MLRYEDINDISDGKLYKESDVVSIGTNGCAGCSKCCESDMGHSIVLTPYDMYELTKATGMSFDDMLVRFLIELSMIDGIVLPHLKMDKGCGFLKDGRCSIHQHRPGICRLFPLGRIYSEKSFDYFIQTKECPVPDKTPVCISDWLGIESLEENTAFINKWHRFIGFEQKKVSEIKKMAGHDVNRIMDIDKEELEIYAGIISEEDIYQEKGEKGYREFRKSRIEEEADQTVKDAIKCCLAYFYLDKYDVEKPFYEQFDDRLKRCIRELRRYN